MYSILIRSIPTQSFKIFPMERVTVLKIEVWDTQTPTSQWKKLCIVQALIIVAVVMCTFALIASDLWKIGMWKKICVFGQSCCLKLPE